MNFRIGRGGFRDGAASLESLILGTTIEYEGIQMHKILYGALTESEDKPRIIETRKGRWIPK